MMIVRVIAVVALAMVAGGAAFREQPPAGAPAVGAELAAKLAALRPENPEGYFLLAEEVADVAEDVAAGEMARTLYVLAFELDRRRPQGGALASSCALGLAAVERLERDRRWLAALAGVMDRRYAQPDWNVAAAPLASDESLQSAATVLGLARSGDGREARRVLDQPGVMDVLRRYERAIGTTGQTGALSRLDKYMQQWPCPECGNERTVRRPGERGVEVRICPVCRGNPGPRLSEEEFIAQLRFEAALLNGIQRSWAAQMIVDQGAPLRDPEPEELAPYYRVDAARVYWREGRWSATP